MKIGIKIGIVSGYWNPIHSGHIDYIKSARSKCDFLIAIVNNDEQVKLKESIPFMDENHRLTIISNLKSVDNAMIAVDKSLNVCETIKIIRKKFEEDLIFFNSGDRVVGNIDNMEMELCLQLGIGFVILPLPKRYSSNAILKEVVIQANKRRSI